MSKRPDQTPKLVAPGIVQMGGNVWQGTGYAAVSNTSMWPYNANVVWQDTTSNSTYCSASKALSQSHAQQVRL